MFVIEASEFVGLSERLRKVEILVAARHRSGDERPVEFQVTLRAPRYKTEGLVVTTATRIQCLIRTLIAISDKKYHRLT